MFGLLIENPSSCIVVHKTYENPIDSTQQKKTLDIPSVDIINHENTSLNLMREKSSNFHSIIVYIYLTR